MSTVHLHLMLNHIPVVGTLFLAALFAAGVVRRNAPLTRTALGSSVALALVALVVFLTGAPAEEAVEDLAGTSEAAIERHEAIALASMVLLGVVGAMSVVVLLWFRRRLEIPRAVAMTGLVASLATVGLMGVTANSGGQIRHSEIRAEGLRVVGDEQARARGHDDDDR